MGEHRRQTVRVDQRRRKAYPAGRWRVESFALADYSVGIVDLTLNGTLRAGSGGKTLATGVESFAVGDGGQDVYWQTTGGNLYESISGGAARLLDVGVESFALADNAVGIVDLTLNGTLRAGSTQR